MTSLSDAYHGTAASQGGSHRLYLGVGLFLIGAALVVAGIVAAGSGFLTTRGYSIGQARWVGGILGGVGIPAVFLGIFTVLPANRTTRAAAVIGASLAMFGVAIFAHAYPCQWIGNTCSTTAVDLTLPTAGVYFLGTLTTFWCLFVGVANFKTRNDPGGTVRMEVTRQGETKIIEVEQSKLGGVGGVGLFGSQPDGNVETQTNTAPKGRLGGGAAATSDGGADAEQLSSPLDSTAGGRPTAGVAGSTGSTTSRPVDRVDSTAEQSWQSAGSQPKTSAGPGSDQAIDRYCGSCAKFKYVRTKAGIQPYCSLHEELMDDMESCESWQAR